MVTLTDERGRQQKVYHDPLGRVAKTEIMNWDQTTVYSTTANVYNARDQVTLVRQYQGNDQSGIYQDTTMGYDGYGRLASKHLPEQNAGANTVYAYNPDDSLLSVTDARGASATYAYNNNRRLVSHVSYDPPSGVPPSGVPDTPDVSFEYDAVGNRTLMTDGFGSKIYTYNQVSQLMSETRNLNGVGTFALNYDYNLAGELKKITDATSMTIKYGFDNAGRLNGVTGWDSLYAGVSEYASSFQYRAWNGLKTMKDGKGFVSSLLYNSKLQPSHFDISGGVANQNYDYYDDGRISFVHNTTDARFDRSYAYDYAGRLSQARSGGRARGDSGEFPYDETFTYDPLSNLTGRASDTWDGGAHLIDTSSYSNNRRTDWGYDADGRNTSIDARSYAFDAAGQMANMTGQQWLFNHYNTVSQTSGFDGDGWKVQEVTNGVTTYYLSSSMLGGAIIEEMSSGGQKNVGYVYAGGQLLAKQSNNQVTWKHSTPAGTSEYLTFNDNSTSGRNEFDPLGANLALQYSPPPENPESEGDIGVGHFGGIMDARWADFFNLSSGCAKEGVAASCSGFMDSVNSGNTRGSLAASSSLNADGLPPDYAPQFLDWVSTKHPEQMNYRTPNPLEAFVLGQEWWGSLQNYDLQADFRDYAVSLAKNKDVTDCMKLALLVYKAGQLATNGAAGATGVQQENLARILLGGLTEFSDIRPLHSMIGAAPFAGSSKEYRVGVYQDDTYGLPSFGGSGFKSDFLKPTSPGSNRVRHAAFYLAAGTLLFPPLAAAKLREAEGGLEENKPDVALGDAAIQMSATYGGNYRSLAQSVWHDLCGQTSNLKLP
jgi:YD repeat-containing protein